MAKRKTTTTVEEEEIQAAAAARQVPALPLEEESEEVKLFTSLLSDFADEADVKVQIFRQPGAANSNLEFLSEMPAEGMSSGALYTMIQEGWGGGLFRIYVRVGGKLARNRLIRIAAPLREGGNLQQDNAVSSIADAMKAGFAELAARLAPAVAPPAPAVAADPLANVNSALQLLEKMKGIVAPGGGSGGEIRSGGILRELETLLSVREKLLDSEPRGGETSFTDVLVALAKGFAPQLQTMLAQVAQQQGQGAPPIPQIPGVITPPLPQQRPVVAASADAPAAPAGDVGGAIGVLIHAAQAGLEPELMVEIFLSTLPEDGNQVVQLLEQREAFVGQILAQRPDLAALRPWFEHLCTVTLDALRAGDEGGENEDGSAETGADAMRSRVTPLIPSRNPRGT